MKCPNCKVDDVVVHDNDSGLSWVSCRKCGFSGSIPQFLKK